MPCPYNISNFGPQLLALQQFSIHHHHRSLISRSHLRSRVVCLTATARRSFIPQQQTSHRHLLASSHSSAATVRRTVIEMIIEVCGAFVVAQGLNDDQVVEKEAAAAGCPTRILSIKS